MGKMSARYSGCMLWMHNNDWFILDEKRDRYILTDKAPKEAQKSFELYKKAKNLNWDDLPIHVG